MSLINQNSPAATENAKNSHFIDEIIVALTSGGLLTNFKDSKMKKTIKVIIRGTMKKSIERFLYLFARGWA